MSGRSVVLDPVVGIGVDAVTGKDRIDLDEIPLGDRPADGADVVLDLSNVPTAHERSTHGRLRDGPAERELRKAPVISDGNRLELVHGPDVVRKRQFAEERLEE